ncbi:MAG: 3',5'-cyclic-nucleotide phosphodiesterase [Planctomycetes bacterium]|nr:3',5'-cyclic-nucleotide phosphodiesterase [Planctomycetota bacterium]
MKIRIVSSSVDSASSEKHFAASYVVNGQVAFDAGTIGFMSSIDDQRRIQHLFLSHGHMDHVASLPIFLDNVYQQGSDPVTIYAPQDTLDCLQSDIFNERLWPDLVRLSQEVSPFMHLSPIAAGETVMACGLRVTSLPLDHVVTTFGYIINDGTGSIAIVSDTQPLDSIWTTLNQVADLKALLLECAFPNRMASLAAKSKHLIPTSFAEGCRQLKRAIPIIAVHIKPVYRDEILNELADLGIPQLVIGVPSTEFEF